MELPAELAGGLKAVDLDAMFGYAVRPNPRVTEEERWNEDDAEPVVVAPAVIEEPEEIDAEAEAEFIEASVPESTDDSDDDSDDDFAVEESDEDDDAEPMDVDAGAPAPAGAGRDARARRAGDRARAGRARARALPFDPTCDACRKRARRPTHAGRSHVRTIAGAQAARDLAARAAARKAPAAQTEALAIFLAAEPTDGAAPAAPKKPLALKPLLTPKSKRVATKAMPKFKAKADAAEHDTGDWKVGRDDAGDGRACYFSPGGRMYASIEQGADPHGRGPEAAHARRADQGRRRHQGPLGVVPLAGDAPGAGRGRLPASDAIAIDATHDSIAQASAIQLLRDRFAAYPEVRSFLAAYDEPHRTVQDKVAALLDADAAPRHLARAAFARKGAGRARRARRLRRAQGAERRARRLSAVGRRRQPALHVLGDERERRGGPTSPTRRTAPTRRRKQRDPASASVDRPRPNLVPAQAAAAYDVVARREALPVNTPTSVLEACRSVVAATLFYGTDLYHYVRKVNGKYGGQIASAAGRTPPSPPPSSPPRS